MSISVRQVILISLVVIVGVGLLAALIIWVLWPIKKKGLQTPGKENFSFSAATKKVAQTNQQEAADGVNPECYSKLYTHSEPTAKAVVMFHGISACPKQFSGLAKYFFDRGYNVYLPLAPEHGRTNHLNHAKVTTQGLVDYTNNSVNITAALGGDIGVVGLSGGANLATWASQYRPEIKRFLALSPFYEPSNSQSPKWQIRPLLILHGNNILPDQLDKPDDPQSALSYRALAKYMTVFKNLPDPARDTDLEHLAVVMADDDDLIDQPLALKTLTGIANANHLTLDRYQIPARLQLGHDIISPDNKYVVQNQEFLHQKYFSLYEQ